MRHSWLAMILFLLPAALFAQHLQSDTIPFSDTLRRGSVVMKSTPNIIYETTIDSVNTLVINEFMVINSGFLFDNAGDDDDWFEIYNYGEVPVPLNNLFFTDDPAVPLKWKLDTLELLALQPKEHFIIWADGEPEEGYNHASFKLSSEGEFLAIFSDDGTLIDHCYFGEQTTNISFGRYPDAGLTWNFFSVPTPATSNALPGLEEVLPAPSSNLTGGLYQAPVILALHSSVAGANIIYTTDCSEPDHTDLIYRKPIEIDTTTVIRARLMKEDAVDGQVLTLSILMDDTEYDNPVISLVAEPDALFGSSGIISRHNSTIEVSADMEYMEEGETKFRGGAGIQLHSPKSFLPNSLKLYARSRYGTDWFEYPFFNDRGPDKFKRLILRNSGNDNVNKAITNTHFRDPLIQTIAKESNRNPMISGSKPVNVFLNGRYHGLFNLREREDRYYIESHTGITENYDFIELEFGYYANRHIIEGSYSTWESLLTFVDTTGDLSLDSDYNLVGETVDLENFTDYWITEVFAGNYDWLSNNVKFWKPEAGKWQWLYWDTDHGLGLNYSNFGNVEWNTLNWSLTFSDRAWSNGYNNILIRNLLRNEKYKALFVKRFTQLLSTSFSFDYTSPMLDSIKNLYRNDMMIHTQHWGRSISDWENAGIIVEDYLRRRPDTVLKHIQAFFNLPDPVPVSLRVEPPGAGTISFSGLEISTLVVEGKFFPGMSYQLQYDSVSDFFFDKWDPFNNQDHHIDFQLNDSLEIVAYFLPSNHSFPIQLCEVYSNNRDAYDSGDWIEFYYYGSETLNMENWYISGDSDQLLYTFPEHAIVKAGQRFVIVQDQERFGGIFPDSFCFGGNMIQGFSTHSRLTLKTANGEIIKSVGLMSSANWPVFPDEGYSFELKSIVDDTGEGSNWELSENRFGSPGLANNMFYDFQKPSGKDSVFTAYETHLLGFTSTQDFYTDQDDHQLAGIAIKEISGPGSFYMEEKEITEGKIYTPSDMVYQPREPYSSSTQMIYTFIDQSGEESAEYTLSFNPTVNVNQKTREHYHLYPIPAKDFCIIEIPPDQQDGLDFLLFDLHGKILQSFHLYSPFHNLTLDLSDTESGIYLYMIKTNSQIVNGKIEVIK